MTITYENMNWMKLTHLFSNLALNFRAHFCTFTLTSKFLIAFLNVHTKEKQYISLTYTMYINALSNTPLTLTLVHMLYEEPTPSMGMKYCHCHNMRRRRPHLILGISSI